MSIQEQGLKRICEPGREEVTGGWRKPHNDQNVLHFLPNIIRFIRQKRYVAHNEREEK
jgi:hypothetical protein